MKAPINNDNQYQVGSIVTAYEYPNRRLRVVDYKERIYYCEPEHNPEQRTLAYFAREIQTTETH